MLQAACVCAALLSSPVGKEFQRHHAWCLLAVGFPRGFTWKSPTRVLWEWIEMEDTDGFGPWH